MRRVKSYPPYSVYCTRCGKKFDLNRRRFLGISHVCRKKKKK